MSLVYRNIKFTLDNPPNPELKIIIDIFTNKYRTEFHWINDAEIEDITNTLKNLSGDDLFLSFVKSIYTTYFYNKSIYIPTPIEIINFMYKDMKLFTPNYYSSLMFTLNKNNKSLLYDMENIIISVLEILKEY